MDPATLAMLASSVLPGIVSGIGAAIAAGDDATAEELKRRAVAEYGPEILPHLEKMVAEKQGGTEFDKIQPGAGRDAQMRALKMMEEEATSGGMTPEDEAAYAQAQQESAGFERGQRGALQTRMAARGIRGGGMDLAAQLTAQQGGIQRQADAGLQTAADARARALHSLESYGGMASDLRAGDYRASADRANAQDSINRFNTELATGANQYNAQLPQQQFENEMGVAGARNNARGDQADWYERRGQRTRNMWAGFGQAAGKAAGGAAQYGGGGK